jgi:hypothetical protein
MAEVFSDDFNLEIGDLLSHPAYPATRQPCARLFMLMCPIQAHYRMFARAPVHACAPASRAHPLLQAIFSHALRVFQEPKTLPEYKHFEPSDPLNPSPGKKHILSFEAPPSRSQPLPRFASMRTPTHPITEPFSPLDMHPHPSHLASPQNTTPEASSIPCSSCPQTHKAKLAARAPRETCALGLNDPDSERR